MDFRESPAEGLKALRNGEETWARNALAESSDPGGSPHLTVPRQGRLQREKYAQNNLRKKHS
jgi:hypothetical protein